MKTGANNHKMYGICNEMVLKSLYLIKFAAQILNTPFI